MSLDAALATGNYRLALHKRWFRKPLLIIERRVVRHHMKDLGGSGYYDEWTTEHWVPTDVVIETKASFFCAAVEAKL